MGSDTAGTEHECPVWKNFRNGDAGALAMIFNEHHGSLYHYGRKLINDDQLVEDCVQNLFLKMWSSREKLMAVKSVRPYLLKAMRRHVRDQIAAMNRKKYLHSQALSEFQITFSHEDFLIALQASSQRSELLAQSLNRLSSRKREAVFLRFYEGLDYAKIAEIMSVNTQSVRNLIHQSLQTIKEELTLPDFPPTAISR